MKIKNELKVGMLALAAIAVLIFGYAYLKGKNILSSNMIIYAVYDDVTGLTNSSTVSINGLKVGLVTGMEFVGDASGRVVITMELDKKKVKIPKNSTIPELVDLSMLGGKMVNLNYTGFCEGDGCLQNGDTLYGKTIGMIDNFTKEIDPYIERVQSVYGMLDSMFKEYAAENGGDDLGLNKTLKDFQATLANLNGTTYQLNKLIANSSSDISGTVSNLNAISSNFKNSEADINRMIKNLGDFSDRLEGIQIEGTVDSTQMTFATVNNSLRNLDGAINDIQTFINQVQNGKGTLSLLINDDGLYKRLDETLKSIELLTDDIRLHPERYRRVLSKKKMPYEPTDDPADKIENQ